MLRAHQQQRTSTSSDDGEAPAPQHGRRLRWLGRASGSVWRACRAGARSMRRRARQHHLHAASAAGGLQQHQQLAALHTGGDREDSASSYSSEDYDDDGTTSHHPPPFWAPRGREPLQQQQLPPHHVLLQQAAGICWRAPDWLLAHVPFLAEQQQQWKQQQLLLLPADATAAGDPHSPAAGEPAAADAALPAPQGTLARRQRRQQQRQRHAHDEQLGSSSGGFSAAALAQMFNPAHTWGMLLHAPAAQAHTGSSSGSAGAGAAAAVCEALESHAAATAQPSSPAGAHGAGAMTPHHSHHSSSHHSTRRPQQLLTVGCRHLSSLLRFKIYEFALYVDVTQAASALQLPSTPLQLAGAQDGSSSSSAPSGLRPAATMHPHSSSSAADLPPALLRQGSSPVDMSLVLKAARDVPLSLLAAEYEKVLQQRLARAGGGPADAAALQALLASFADARRLPALVTTADSGSSSSSGAGGGGGGGGGSVRRGAMIVFERSGAGDVTARVGHVVLTKVHSPKVAEALFGLYLGDQPVSRPAKEAAAATLARIAAARSGGRGSSGSGGGSDGVQAVQDRDMPAQQQEHQAPGQQQQQRQQQRQRRNRQQHEEEQQPLGVPALATYYLPANRAQTIRCSGSSSSGSQERGGRRTQLLGRRRGRGAPAAAAAAVVVGAGQVLGQEQLAACELHIA